VEELLKLLHQVESTTAVEIAWLWFYAKVLELGLIAVVIGFLIYAIYRIITSDDS